MSVLIAGVDEAGRGPLAGPVVAAAVILDPKRPIRGLRDSKQLDPGASRSAGAAHPRARARRGGRAGRSREVDLFNILQATLLAMKWALLSLPERPTEIMIDGNCAPQLHDCFADCKVQYGDRRRCARPLHQRRLDHRQDPPRRADGAAGSALSGLRTWRQHFGYATRAHLAALVRLGPSPIHRRSFNPLRSWLSGELPFGGLPARHAALRISRLRSSSIERSRLAMKATFVHLRLHTEYSLIDSVVRVPELIEAVAAARHAGGRGHRSVQSVRDGQVLSRGARARRAADHRRRSAAARRGENQGASRLTLLCQDETGYRNLARLVSRAYLEGQSGHAVPLVDRRWLERASTAGLIALSGAAEGDIGRALLRQRELPASSRCSTTGSSCSKTASTSNCSGSAALEEPQYLQAAMQLAARRGVPVVATNDVRFLSPEDFEAHEARVCIHDGTLLADAARPRRYQRLQYLRSRRTDGGIVCRSARSARQFGRNRAPLQSAPDARSGAPAGLSGARRHHAD